MSLRAARKRVRPAGDSAGRQLQMADTLYSSIAEALARFNAALDALETALRRLDQVLAAAAFRREAP